MTGGRQRSLIEQRIAWTRFRRQTDKDVLMALARWFCWRADGSHVRPSSLPALALKADVSERSLDRALRRLVDDGYLWVTARQHRGTSTYQIVLTRLATRDPDQAVIAVDNTARHSGAQEELDDGLARQSGAQDESGAQGNRPNFEKVARTYRSEAAEEGSIRPAPAGVRARHSGAQPDPAVAAFAAWWTLTYPAHNDGAQNPIDAGQDGALIQELLEAYPVDLQAMALLMWHVVPDRNPQSHRSWIAAGDRGLRVLRRKAAFLQLALSDPEQLTFGPMEEVKLTARELDEAKEIHRRCGGYCRHDPEHDDWRDCVRAIALKRHVG